jgi:Terminase large subunit, T4likevirus-type, N-terminal
MDVADLLKETGISLPELKTIVASPQKFVEKFIRNPETGSLFKLNGPQKEIFLAAERHTPHNAICLHRRSGKTQSLVLLAIYILMTDRNIKILFMAPFNSQVEAFFNELRKVVEFHPWINNSVVESTKNPYWLKFSNGAAIRGMTTGSKSKAKAGSARGQGAHFVFLDEVAFMSDEDFGSLKPIIEGDAYHQSPVVFAVSTPMGAVGQFYRWVERIRPETVKLDGDGIPLRDENGDPVLEDYEPWNVVRLAITENPDWDKARVERIRNEVTTREWQTEYLCEFLNSGDTVFDLAKLKECGSLNYNYFDLKPKPGPTRNEYTGKPERHFWRTMGVDWDKFNRDGSGPTIVMLDCDERPADPVEGTYAGDGKLRVVYRESIPQSEYCLTHTCDRILELNRLYNPDVIQVDAGLGEMQIETLQLIGKRTPGSRLEKKVRRTNFSEVVEIQSPLGGLVKKKFKPFMVNLLTKWIEDRAIEYPAADRQFYEQFSGYRVKSVTLNGEQYTSENEHIIDATGLAAYAMFQIHASPFRHQIAVNGIVLPPQEVVPGDEMTEEQMAMFRRQSPTSALLVRRDRTKLHPDLMDLTPKINKDESTLFQKPKRDTTVQDLFARRERPVLFSGRRRSQF